MPQATIDNQTACSTQALFVSNERGEPVLTQVVKATFSISADGELRFKKRQAPIYLGGEYWGNPEKSSYKFEPECVFFKPSTDVVVIAQALSNRPVTSLSVSIQVDSMQQNFVVFGDRFWQRSRTGFTMSKPSPFERMPITYENAFGGWDRHHQDESQWAYESRNTLGKGYYCKASHTRSDALALPNIELPNQLIQSIRDRPEPAGCGFTLPHWQPRAALAGTYDEHWQKQRNPLLPEDFDLRFFNAANNALISDRYLRGDEDILVTNVSVSGELSFRLPGARAPLIKVTRREGFDELESVLDTVVIDTISMELQLTWRATMPLPAGYHDVNSIEVCYA